MFLNVVTMKLEKILDRLNSLEKGPFIKIVNNLVSLQKNSPDIEALLASSDRNLKNADSIQLAEVFEKVSPAFGDYILEEYTKTTSQLDILLEILTRDGNCIMRVDWFTKLYEEQIRRQKKAAEEFKRNLNSDKSTLDPSRTRDYRIFEACLSTAYHNDESNNFDPKITSDEQSILDTLSNGLELSHDEVTMIKYSVLGIPKTSIDEVVADLKDKGLVFLSRKTNTLYVADEVVSILRKISGKEVADKFFRRVLLQLREPQLNTICRKHGIDIKLPVKDKIEAIIVSGVSFSSILKEELHKPETKFIDRRKFVTELCDEKLAISPSIKGVSLDDKVNNLIAYFDRLYKDERIGISSGGYEKLLIDLEELVPTTNKILKVTFQLQEENVMHSDFLTEYNIMPRDVLELLSLEDLTTLCTARGIKARGNLVDNILAFYRDSESLYVENYEHIGARDINALKSNGLAIKEAELGAKFEEVTRFIFGKLGFDVDEKLRKKLNTEKDKMDILLKVEDNTVILVECKTVKDSGYNKFSTISRQVKAYKSLLERNGYSVAKILIVAPDFSEDFISDCGDDFDLNISLMKASSLAAIYNVAKELTGKKVTAQMLMKDVLIQEERIIRALKK